MKLTEFIFLYMCICCVVTLVVRSIQEKTEISKTDMTSTLIVRNKHPWEFDVFFFSSLSSDLCVYCAQMMFIFDISLIQSPSAKAQTSGKKTKD